MKETELISQLQELATKIKQSWSFLDIEQKIKELQQLEATMSQPGFWQKQAAAKEISQKASNLKEEIGTWQNLKNDIKMLLELAELDQKDQTINLRSEVVERFGQLEQKFNQLEFFLLFREAHDRNNAILAIHAGTGGVDAMDWAAMLLRMYLRFCEQHGFITKILDQSLGSEAGVKSVVLEVQGNYAYGNLKSENGVHRLVRISPFDAEAMRHTSFALVEVIPEIDEDINIEIKTEDLKIDTYRASGKGGQNVNKTETAIRITHLPTKIVVTCQSERSQLQNRERALKILKSKLYKLAETKIESEKKQLRGEFTEAAWSNQIRSYVLQPYHLVKDHRTNYEQSDVQAVLNGDLAGFIEAYLKIKK